MTDPVTMKHDNVCELERMGGAAVKSPSNSLELDAVGTIK